MTDQTETKAVSLADPLATILASRWTWKDSTIPVVQHTFGYLTKLAAAGNAVRNERDLAHASGRLTEAGMKEHLLDFASRDFAPAYRKADHDGRRGILRTIETLRAQGVRKIDPTDVAAAMVRSDLRRMWDLMEPHAQAAMLHNPPSMLATALLEMPREFTGLTDNKADALREAAFGHEFPELSTQIEELREVLQLTEAAMRIARDDAMRTMALPKHDFDMLVWGGTPDGDV